MKKTGLLLIFLFPLLSFAQSAKKLPLIKAKKSVADIRVDGFLNKGGWRIAPELRPDVYTVACKTIPTEVVFYTERDSIRFSVKPGDKHRFYILVNGKDSALTEVQGVKYIPPTTFSEEYIREHRGKWFVEVPEVQELVHIIMAITPKGIEDRNMVNHTTRYYKHVITHFERFRDEPIVLKIDTLLRQGYYAHLKMNSCAFVFNGDDIVEGGIYDRLSWNDNNNIRPFLPELKDFAYKSAFRDFYAANQHYYDAQKEELIRYMPIEKQWKWCEDHFTTKYDSYKVTFSPLVEGSHSTNRFSDKDYSETVMFVCAAFTDPKWNANVTEGLNTRVVFTEIDHNYVNPVSDIHAARISKIFDNRKKWTNGGDAPNYPDPYSVFNEYMTWGVFTLYSYDTFPPEDFEVINSYTESLIGKGRGFYRFPEFNRKLLELYKASPGKKIEEFYPQMLDWCAKLK